MVKPLIHLVPFYTPSHPLPSEKFESLLLVDVYRATSFIVTSAQKGAISWIAAETVDQARALKRDNPHLMLCGERDSLPPEGFEMGNSPSEAFTKDLEGRKMVITTTNGTRSLSGMRGRYDKAYALSLLNLTNAARTIAQMRPRSLILVCAGNTDTLSLEDFLCAGLFIHILHGYTGGAGLEPQDDAVRLALDASAPYYDKTPLLHQRLRMTTHAQSLQKKGLYHDVEFILQHQDAFAHLPRIQQP